MENKIVNVIDIIAPHVEFLNNSTRASHPSIRLKPNSNKKHRLLKRFKSTKDPNLRNQIQLLSNVIKIDLKNSKKSIIRRSLVPGSS